MFMGFSITSAVLGGVIIICYSISIAINRSEYRYNYDYGYGYIRGLYDAKMAITAIILVLGVAEFVIGIWAAICCCLIQPCCATQQVSKSGKRHLEGFSNTTTTMILFINHILLFLWHCQHMALPTKEATATTMNKLKYLIIFIRKNVKNV